jgi:hypothetical protein
LSYERDGLCKRRDADAKSAFDDTRLAADLPRKIEDRCLSLAKRTHPLETFDRCVSRLQCFEASHRADQLLQLAIVSFDDIVKILDLPMNCVLRTFALGL